MKKIARKAPSRASSPTPSPKAPVASDRAVALNPTENALVLLAHARRGDAVARITEKAQAQMDAADAQLQADLIAVIGVHVDPTKQTLTVNFQRAKSGDWAMVVREADLPAPVAESEG